MTLVIGHRGASAVAPENTLAAFRVAVEAGADAIELDVHLTADGEIAVIHDETLDRTTDRTGAVAGLTMDAIRAADAGSTFPGPRGDFPFRGRGVTVPTLREVLVWLPDGVGLAVEIKARAAVDAVVATVEGAGVERDGRLRVMSFDERSIERVRQLDRHIGTGYLLDRGQDPHAALAWASERGHRTVLPYDADLGLDPNPIVEAARAHGLELACWVVNDAARMRQLAACGLWGFVTDRPDVGRQTLRR